MVALIASRWSRVERGYFVDIDVLLAGLTLFVTPIVTQAPIAAFASSLTADMSAIEAGMQSRLYYLQFAGLMLMLGAAIAALYRVASRWTRIAVACSMSLITATFAWASHDNAREFGERSFAIAAPARAAIVAVESLVIPENHCHIAFLGYMPPPEWSNYVSMDSIVKGLSPRKSIRNCWIHADTQTYFHMQSTSASVADALPFRPLRKDGLEVPWRRVGKFVYAYLDVPDEKAVVDSGMPIFTMKDGRFVDASADVRAGAIPVRLK